MNSILVFDKGKYEPIVISLRKDDTIDDVILNLSDVGFGENVSDSITSILPSSLQEKIEYLARVFIKIQDSKEFVIFRDQGTLIQNGDISWWLIKALDLIRDELTIGIVTSSSIRYNSKSNKDCYIEQISELDSSSKLKLLDVLSQENKIILDREDIKFFENIITGHPLQIIFCVQKIVNESLEEVKDHSYIISDFLSKSTIKIIDKYLSLLHYDEEMTEKFLSYLAFLSSYSNIPISEVIRINRLDKDYEVFYQNLLFRQKTNGFITF